MHWIDIDLTGPPQDPDRQKLLQEAGTACQALADLQGSVGLDSPLVVKQMVEVGQILFRAATLFAPNAFVPVPDAEGEKNPYVGQTETDNVFGYHLQVPPNAVGLPWSWLHNGLEFLLERYPLCASINPSSLPAGPHQKPWMKRLGEIRRAEKLHGVRPLRETLARLRPKECADPEILFVPGHCEEKIRRLIFREADGIKRALLAGPLGRPLAQLSVLTEAITPTLLSRKGSTYQGLHYAGPTAKPLAASDRESARWLEELTRSTPEAGADPAAETVLDGVWPEELEPVGVDPITALLDTVTARAQHRERQPSPAIAGRAAGTTWWLEDGPVLPEDLGRQGGLPSLVFSNSYRSLPELGPRFLTSGASVFIGPVAGVFSRPARKFAGRFYSFLADGHSTATAFQQAALACREQFGRDHPVWLSYGIVGYGSLALQYL